MSLGQAYVKVRRLTSRRQPHQGESACPASRSKTLLQRSAGWTPESLRTGRLVDYADAPAAAAWTSSPCCDTDLLRGLQVHGGDDARRVSASLEKAEAAAYGETRARLHGALRDDREAPRVHPGHRRAAGGRRPASSPSSTTASPRPCAAAWTTRRCAAPASRPSCSASSTRLPSALRPPRPATATRIRSCAPSRRSASPAAPSPRRSRMHPTDWLNERLRKTKDGAYIWGNPDVQPGITSMWGRAHRPGRRAHGPGHGRSPATSACTRRTSRARKSSVKSGYINDDLDQGPQRRRRLPPRLPSSGSARRRSPSSRCPEPDRSRPRG
jgi:hypothetical protein